MIDCDTVVIGFELQSRYDVQFRANTRKNKKMDSTIWVRILDKVTALYFTLMTLAKAWVNHFIFLWGSSRADWAATSLEERKLWIQIVENIWIHTFPKSKSTMGNSNILVQDLNWVRRVHFQRCEIQTSSFRIWTRFAESIFNDRYIMSANSI